VITFFSGRDSGLSSTTTTTYVSTTTMAGQSGAKRGKKKAQVSIAKVSDSFELTSRP
jgi:hypothetical protein